MLLKWERSGPNEAFDVVDSMTVKVSITRLIEEIGVRHNWVVRLSLSFQQLLPSRHVSIR